MLVFYLFYTLTPSSLSPTSYLQHYSNQHRTNIEPIPYKHPANPYHTTPRSPSYFLSLTSQPSFHNTQKPHTFASNSGFTPIP
nr:MAG TPA: hypothetical protein [Caudoviricetes sp.]